MGPSGETCFFPGISSPLKMVKNCLFRFRTKMVVPSEKGPESIPIFVVEISKNGFSHLLADRSQYKPPDNENKEKKPTIAFAADVKNINTYSLSNLLFLRQKHGKHLGRKYIYLNIPNRRLDLFKVFTFSPISFIPFLGCLFCLQKEEKKLFSWLMCEFLPAMGPGWGDMFLARNLVSTVDGKKLLVPDFVPRW
ncbi:hypothetical protein CEXT_385221 [Caerostris extrusa]|uniref:Uncharacterized protein n=1 Tax=Caerostris extrusa TaxID=172846 RepID=A0AAV4UQ45_CAEEX|nr:hypothetical protein CEXT_385221 [Caerostris extrusa]